MNLFWKNPVLANGIADSVGLPDYLRGDVVPLTRDDALQLANFYNVVDRLHPDKNVRNLVNFFKNKNYKTDLITRIAISNAKSKGTTKQTDYESSILAERERVSRAFKAGGSSHDSVLNELIKEFIVDEHGSFKQSALKKAYVVGENYDTPTGQKATQTWLSSGVQ